MFELSIFFKERLVARSAFSLAAVRIGRSPDNEVQVEDRALSRRHASIEDVGGVHVLHDLGSENGTFVNGEPVSGRRALNDGDRIALGGYRLVFHAPRSEAPPRSAREGSGEGEGVETDVAPITPEQRERPCPFVASLVLAARTKKEPARLFALTKDLVVVGSLPASDLVLEGAPPRAAAIVRGWRGFQLLALAPGVARNGAPVADRADLGQGDELAFGAARVRYVVGREDLSP